MSTNAYHLQQQQPAAAAADAREPPDGTVREVSALPAGLPRPVTFYSIEVETPARDFWECLARLLSLLGALARRRAARR